MNKKLTGRTLPESGRRKWLPIVLLLLLAGGLIAAGMLLDENGLVGQNAHYLCLDCIGIG